MNRKEGRIPIAKNTDSEGKKTVRVLDEKGNQIGLTYPKRAAGLVKKGRAYYVNDFIIRLSMSDALLPDSRQKSEVMKMDNHITIDSTNKEAENQVFKLYFEPRKWFFNKSCEHNVGSRSFITGPDGVLAEGYMIGDWNWKNWTEIVSETFLLPKNTDCSFTFWLNGGENDRNDEVCRLDIVFDNNHEQRLTYNLNRNFIRPLKKLNGWELYEIPFRTGNNAYTELRFAAHKAYMTVLQAKDASAYEGFADNADPFEAERPQRHNIIFSDGYPANGWYSTKALQEAHQIKNAVIPGIPQFLHMQQDAANAEIPAFLQQPESSASVNGQEGSQENPGTHMADSDANRSGASAAALVKEIFDCVKNGAYDSAEDFEDIVENKGEIIRGIIENALQNLQGTLKQIANEVHITANARLDAISANLDALSSTCDMLEDLDVDNIADNIRAEQRNEDEDDEDEDMENILSDAADFMSDIAEELRESIEEITDQLEELRDVLSM